MKIIIKKTLALIGVILMLGGCSLLGFKRADIGPNLKVIIAPRTASYRRDRAALIFFAPSRQSQTLTAECTAIFQKAFLKHKVFKIIEPCSAPRETEEYLMDLAEEKGFDILVEGRLADFYLAHGAEKARAAVSLKVYDLKTRVTLWYIDYATQEAGREAEDWIVWKRAQKDPPSPYFILTRIAEEMAVMMVMER